MNLGFKDKVVLVAGGSKGLGYAIAKACAQDGARVAIASRHQDNVARAVASLQRDCDALAMGTSADMSQAADITAWVDAVVARFGRIDGVVVNSGGPPPGGFDQFDDAAWQAGFDNTLMSAVRLIRAALPHMRAQGRGSIVTITSSSIREPIDTLLLSNVFRSGVASLVKSLSRQLAAQGVRINNLVPGRVSTDRMIALDSAAAAARNIPLEQLRAEGMKQVPMQRYGEPDEFGKAGAFLLSDAASYITGATLVVDGGSMRSV